MSPPDLPAQGSGAGRDGATAGQGDVSGADGDVAGVRAQARAPRADGDARYCHFVDWAGAGVALALVVLVRVGVTAPIRIALTLLFVTFVPGWAVVGHWKAVHGMSKGALAVAASLTMCTAGALAMAWLRWWHPFGLFYAVGGVTAGALLWKSARHAIGVAEPWTDEPIIGAPAVPAVPPKPRRLPLSSDDLRITSVEVSATFVPRSPFGPHELTDFFAQVHYHHPFMTFNLDGDSGAIMETIGACRLAVGRDRVEYREQVTDFHQAKGNAVDLLGEVQRRLGVPSLASSTCHVRAHWDLAQDSERADLFAGAMLLDGCSNILGSTGPVSVELRVFGESKEPDLTWQVILEPQPTGDFLIDLTTDFQPAAGATIAVSEQLDHAQMFMTENVATFVASLTAPTRAG